MSERLHGISKNISLGVTSANDPNMQKTRCFCEINKRLHPFVFPFR